jgi:hypothetical protein
VRRVFSALRVDIFFAKELTLGAVSYASNLHSDAYRHAELLIGTTAHSVWQNKRLDTKLGINCFLLWEKILF